MRRLLAARRVNPLLWALSAWGLLLLATVWIIVFRAQPEPVRFVPTGTPQATPRALQTQSLLAQMARGGGLPATDLLAASALAEAPDFILPESTEHSMGNAFSASIAAGDLYGTSAWADSAAGTGTDWSAAIGNALSAAEPVEFFGIGERAERYLIVLDTSNSMFVRSRSGQRYRYNYGQIKDETARLLSSFSANTLFNLIVYEGGAWAWQQDLQVGSAPARQRAADWVRGLGENPSLSIRDRRGEGPLLLEGGGTRLDTALKLAFTHYDPQVVFIVTDGEINSIPGGRITEEALIAQLRALQAAQREPARVHVIHFQTAQMREVELQTMRAIARQGKGQFIQITAQER